jgi:lysophospholipase L1-like esterase
MSTQTLRNGVSTTVNLQPAEALKVVAVTGSYTLRGLAGSVAGTIIATAATGGTYGPYPAAVTLQLTSSALSEIDFDSGTAPVIDSDTPAMVNTNPFTGGLVFPESQRPNTLAVIGDSISAAWRSSAPTISERNPKGYLAWALALSGERLTVVSDQSLGGSQILAAGAGTQIGTTQLAAAIASGAGHLLIQGGINDIFQAGATAAQMKAGWKDMLNTATAAGMKVWVIITHTPNSAYSSYTAGNQGRMLEVNDWLRNQASTAYARGNVTVVDLASVVVDPVSATASARANYLYDNIHPRNIGAQAMGAELARVWMQSVPEAPQLLSSNADNQAFNAASTNILDNGLMVAGTTLATGFSSSVTGSGATTDSLVARSDGFGNDQQRVITFGANNDSVRMFTSDVKARIADGDTVVMSCEVTPSAMTATRVIRASLTLTGASSSLSATTMQLDATNDLAMTTAQTHILKTNPITVNLATLGALTSVQGSVAAFGSGAGGMTLKIGRWSIRKVPAPI